MPKLFKFGYYNIAFGITTWLILFLYKINIWLAVFGSIVGYINALLSLKTMLKDKMEASYKNLIPMAIAILAYYVAEYFGGNGFIAAFFSGLFLGNYNDKLRENVENFIESESELLILISFIILNSNRFCKIESFPDLNP